MQNCSCGHLIKFQFNEKWLHNSQVKIRSKWKDRLNMKCEKCDCINPQKRQQR